MCTQETGRLDRLLAPISVSFFCVRRMTTVVEKPTPHCGRWSGSNHPGSCNYWGRCFLFGSGTCKQTSSRYSPTATTVQSHLCVKSTQNKWDLIINELAAHRIFLGSPFMSVFSTLLPPDPPNTEENSNIYLTQPIQLAARLPGTRPVAASFSAANTLLSRSKQLFSYV